MGEDGRVESRIELRVGRTAHFLTTGVSQPACLNFAYLLYLYKLKEILYFSNKSHGAFLTLYWSPNV